MPVVVGSFGTQSDAETALDRLQASGVSTDDLALVSQAHDAVGAPEDAEQRATHAVDGAAAGAAMGAVLGGALLGPIGAVLGGTVLGGGIAAALTSHGLQEADARRYAERLHQGRYLLVARVDGPVEPVERMLHEAGADRVELDAER